MKTIRVYKEYESFGELALINNKKRAAKLEVSTRGSAFFAVLSRRDYRMALSKNEQEDLQNKKSFLKRFFIFRNMSDTALTSLVKAMVEHTCSKG